MGLDQYEVRNWVGWYRHDALGKLAMRLNSREPLEFQQLKHLLETIKTESIRYQKDKLSFFGSKVAKKSDEIIKETNTFLQSKK